MSGTLRDRKGLMHRTWEIGIRQWIKIQHERQKEALMIVSLGWVGWLKEVELVLAASLTASYGNERALWTGKKAQSPKKTQIIFRFTRMPDSSHKCTTQSVKKAY